MDKVDYTFKFSTELLVSALCLFLIALNTSGSLTLKRFNNSSLFSRELSYHPKMNTSLSNKSMSVETIVEHGQGGIIAQASAKIVLAAEEADTDPQQPPQPSEQTAISGNTIAKSNPSNVRALILDQIKVYDTQNGDTIQGIAAKFGINSNTIVWANNLPSRKIKPGWNLLILPLNGVLHTVTDNDTLPDIAKKFKADESRIISYNNLADENDINPGDILIIPDGSVPAPPKPKPAVKRSIKGKVFYEDAPESIQELKGRPHRFPKGQCTYYVAQRRQVTWGGNAKMWLANASALGAQTGKTPVRGAIVVTTDNRRYGHVAIVEKVEGDSFLISEMNYKGRGVITNRWLNAADSTVRGFIY